MKRRLQRSINLFDHDSVPLIEVTEAVQGNLIGMVGGKERKAAVPSGYEIHCYYAQAHLLRIDIHRLDRQHFYAPSSPAEGEAEEEGEA